MYKTIFNDDGTPTDYEVDTHSNIRNRFTKEFVNVRIVYMSGKFRHFASIKFNTKYVNGQIGRWCLMAHKPNPNYKSLQVDHIDGDPSNNELNNLEWVTRDENMRRAGELGLLPYGNNHHNCKYSDNLVRDICQDICDGLSRQDIAKKYNILPNTIDDIKSGRSHKRISKEFLDKGFKYSEYDKESKDDLYRRICQMLQDGISQTQIAKECGVNFCFVADIKHRRKGLYISKDYTF